jgi:hypothetical protein
MLSDVSKQEHGPKHAIFRVQRTVKIIRVADPGGDVKGEPGGSGVSSVQRGAAET